MEDAASSASVAPMVLQDADQVEDHYIMIDGELYNRQLLSEAQGLVQEIGAVNVEDAKSLWMATSWHKDEGDEKYMEVDLRTIEHIIQQKDIPLDLSAELFLKESVKQAKADLKAKYKEQHATTPQRRGKKPKESVEMTPLKEIERLEEQIMGATNAKKVEQLQKKILKVMQKAESQQLERSQKKPAAAENEEEAEDEDQEEEEQVATALFPDDGDEEETATRPPSRKRPAAADEEVEEVAADEEVEEVTPEVSKKPAVAEEEVIAPKGRGRPRKRPAADDEEVQEVGADEEVEEETPEVSKRPAALKKPAAAAQVLSAPPANGKFVPTSFVPVSPSLAGTPMTPRMVPRKRITSKRRCYADEAQGRWVSA